MSEAAKKQRGRRGRKRVCAFCVEKIDRIDYKDVVRLKSTLQSGARFFPEGSPAIVPDTSGR